MHVSDLFSTEYPNGNYSGTMSYVADPERDSTIPLHMLWDSNTLRTTEFEEIEQYAARYMENAPRSSFLQLNTQVRSDTFDEWAQESYKIAQEFAYGAEIETVVDPNNKEMDTGKLLKGIILWVQEGVSPVATAPEVPADYWEKLQSITKQRVSLAGFRTADIIILAME